MYLSNSAPSMSGCSNISYIPNNTCNQRNFGYMSPSHQFAPVGSLDTLYHSTQPRQRNIAGMNSTIELNAPRIEPYKQRHQKSLDEEGIFGPPIIPEPSKKKREISPLDKQE